MITLNCLEYVIIKLIVCCRWEIWQWFTELDSLTRRIPPAGVSIQPLSPVAAALERELDRMSVLQHLKLYVFIPSARAALEELVLDSCGVPSDTVT